MRCQAFSIVFKCETDLATRKSTFASKIQVPDTNIDMMYPSKYLVKKRFAQSLVSRAGQAETGSSFVDAQFSEQLHKRIMPLWKASTGNAVNGGA